MSLTETSPSKTRQLAAFGAGLCEEDLPRDVVHNAKRALLDWVTAVLAGSREPGAEKLHRVIMAVAPEQAASIVGTDQRTSAPFAALANGYAAHLQDFDDVFNPVQTTVHLSSCVWPVVMALSQIRHISGPTAIASFVAGFETGARVGCAAGIAHYQSSWQVTGTAGHLASAAAGARALSLSSDSATNALGMAAAQASGIREIYGSDTKALQPGKAAMDGVLSALLAEEGFTSRDTALEGPRGLLHAVSSAPDADLLVDGLNSHWHIRENGHKLYPSASLIHPAVDAAIALFDRQEFLAEDVVSVEVRMLPFAADVTAVVHPRPGAEAKFSSRHCVAVALTYGRLGLDDFDARTISEPALAALRSKITVLPDENVGKRGAVVTATLRNGTVATETVEQNRGTPGNRLSDAALETKFLEVAESRIGAGAARQVINHCWDFSFVEDASDLLAPLRGALHGAA
jgi:2-methylcitrate dehydratase PrpD